MYLPKLTGAIVAYGKTTAPQGWLLCDGSAVSRTTYTKLMDIISTTWGAGDGATTFNVPDMRDYFVVGAKDTYAIASTGGAATVTLDATTIPSHNHTQTAHNHNITDPGHTHGHNFRPVYPPTANYDISGLGLAGDTTATIYRGTTDISLQNTTATNQNTGGGGSHNNLPSYIGLVYIIKY